MFQKYTHKSIHYFDLVSSAQLEPLGPIFRQCFGQPHLRRTPACGRRRGPELGKTPGWKWELPHGFAARFRSRTTAPCKCWLSSRPIPRSRCPTLISPSLFLTLLHFPLARLPPKLKLPLFTFTLEMCAWSTSLHSEVDQNCVPKHRGFIPTLSPSMLRAESLGQEEKR